MKIAKKTAGFIFLCILVSTMMADTFKHKESGESFSGFVTQKTAGNNTLVYNDDESKMMPVVLSDYDIVYNVMGRRDGVSLLELTSPEIFLSDAVSKKVATAIVEISNKGPIAIIVRIDSPGGRGDYMKTVADAILQTKNCPVISYISGGSYGGAYSAAAIVALSCDKVYINPTAGIGAVGSVAGGYLGKESYADYIQIYSSDTLLTYSSFVNGIAHSKTYPGLLLRGFIDKRLSIIEVANIDGSREFIEKDNRQPTQTLIRTLAEGMATSQKASDISPEDVVGNVLNLTAKDAMELKLVNGYATSVTEILSGMQIADAKITPIGGIQDIVKAYISAKRRISDSLDRIDLYENNIDSLSEQFAAIDKQLRLSTQTREISQGTTGYTSSRTREGFPSNYNYYYGTSTGSVGRTDGNYQSRQNRLPRAQTIITEEPMVNIQIVYNQLTTSLRGLISEYRGVLNLVKRWPGGLPPEMTPTMLQKNMESASAELNNLYLYSPVYPNQVQSQFPQRSGRSRTR
jgi:ATP-dependent protease ClpP protease subunit